VTGRGEAAKAQENQPEYHPRREDDSHAGPSTQWKCQELRAFSGLPLLIFSFYPSAELAAGADPVQRNV
jgi:hypothetical protein